MRFKAPAIKESRSSLFVSKDLRTATDAVLRKNSIGHRLLHVYDAALLGFAAQMSPADAAKLAKDPRVASVSEDMPAYTTTTQSSAPWHLDRIDQSSLPLDSSYTYASSGSGVHVYVIDTGVRLDHTEFTGRIGSSYWASGMDSNPSADAPAGCNGHGTHVAGIIGGTTYGVAKSVTIHPVRVFPCTGTSTNSKVISGINWVINNHVHPAVINLSLGSAPDTDLDDAVIAALDHNITVTISAGNESIDACLKSPARVTDAIIVGASKSNDMRARFSNVGTCLDLLAPGQSVLSAYNSSSSSTATLSGTSMAAPGVAGAAALYLAWNTSARPSTVRNGIIMSAASNKISDSLSDSYAVSGALDSLTSGWAVYANNPTIKTKYGTGNVDVYVGFNFVPTTTNYSCRSIFSGNTESCTMSNGAGTYYTLLKGTAAYSGVTLTVTGTGSLGAPLTTPNYLLGMTTLD